MAGQLRRDFVFAGTSAAVVYDSRTAALIDFLCHAIPSVSVGAAERVFRLTTDSDAVFSLYDGNRQLYRGAAEAELASVLLSALCHHLAAESRGGLVFHAAALSRDGQGVLFPGGIGAGKTTLAAWLALQGYTYLTDELVYVPAGTAQMHTLARPLNLKAGSREALHPYFDFSVHAPAILSTPDADLIPAKLLMPSASAAIPAEGSGMAIPVSRIVFPRFAVGGAFELSALSPAQAGQRLMQCLVNARNLPSYGFHDAVFLARSSPAWSLSYAGFAGILDALDRVLLADS